jgi:hypothetical protein
MLLSMLGVIATMKGEFGFITPEDDEDSSNYQVFLSFYHFTNSVTTVHHFILKLHFQKLCVLCFWFVPRNVFL